MLTITAAALKSIAITPSVLTLNAGGNAQQLSVVGTYTDGSSKAIQATNWSSSDTSVAVVSSSGVITPLTSGTTNVQATYQSLSASLGVLVSVPSPLTISSTGPSTITTTEAVRNSLNIIVKDQNGNPVSGATIKWSSASGWLFETSATTDVNGRASAIWVAGAAPNSSVTVSAVQNGSMGTLTFAAVIGQVTTNTSAVYFDYFLPAGAIPDGFRNTLTPIYDPPATFYSAILFDGGYTGMQRSGSLFDRQLQFSMADDPTGGQAQVIDPGVSTCVRYSGEGTGWACASSYNWVVGNQYTFTVTFTNGAASTDYTASMTDVANNVTVNLGTLRLQRIAKQNGVLYSFIEQFTYFDASCLQTAARKTLTTGAYRQNGIWLKYSDGYVAYSNSVGNCDNMNYGVQNGQTFFSTGGTDVGDVPSGGFKVPLPQ